MGEGEITLINEPSPSRDKGSDQLEHTAIQDSCSRLFNLTKLLEELKDPGGNKEDIRATIKLKIGCKHLVLKKPNEKEIKKNKSKNKKNESAKITPTGARTLVILHEKMIEPKNQRNGFKIYWKN